MIQTNATQVGYAGVNSFVINGVDIAAYVNKLEIFESVCKPYITARALILDNSKLVDRLGLRGGEPVSFSISASGGGGYSGSGALHSLTKENLSENARTLAYELQVIGPEYYTERSNIISKSFQQITATDAISQIHSEGVGGGLSIPVASNGLLFPVNPYVVDKLKPFKAIDEFRKILTFAQYQSGVTCYYRNNSGCVLAPAEYMFQQASGGGPSFYQSVTPGFAWENMILNTNQIIDYTTSIPGEEQQGNRLSISETLMALKQEYRVLDKKSNKLIYDIPPSPVPIPTTDGQYNQQAQQIAYGGNGGQQQFLVVDTDKIPAQFVRRTDIEALFRAIVSCTPSVYAKFPIQGGLSVTVGAGINLNILSPAGLDESGGNYEDSELTGPYLVADLTHEIHNDNNLSSTTCRCMRGGWN
jgi:hypothetical protein